MNNKLDPLQHFKSEADEYLFANLHFDSLLKERVLHSLSAENKRYSMKELLRPRWVKWSVSVITAAVVASVIFFSLPDLKQETIVSQPNIVQPTEGAIEGTSTPLQTFGTYNQPEESDSIGLPTQQFQLKSVEDAVTWYGDQLLTPSYTPDHFQLNNIHAHGKSRELADTISLTYIFDDRSYDIIQQKLVLPVSSSFEEKVDIHGIEASMTIQSDASIIQWYTDGVQFTVSGMISKEEALLIARSLYE